MATGYTSIVGEKPDITFTEFAMRCSRAFGAMIEMRDDPSDETIPVKFEKDDYHTKAKRKAQSRLARLKHLSPRRRWVNGNRRLQHELAYNVEALAKALKLRGNYQRLLAEAQAWNPPSKDHQHMKEFMVEQLTSSIRFDCQEAFHVEQMQKALADGPIGFFRKALADARWDLRYHQKEAKKGSERDDGRNEWVAQLRQSLGLPTDQPTTFQEPLKLARNSQVHVFDGKSK